MEGETERKLLGGACFSHGPYTFYKAVRIGNGRVLRLGSFFLTKLWTDADLVSIGELQLLWLDSRGSNQPLASLRLYFLPENTPDGRRSTHGEDEVLTISEKVVVRVHDLVTWLTPTMEWSWGRKTLFPMSPKLSSSPDKSPRKHDGNYPQVLTDPGIDFTEVDKQQKEFQTNLSTVKKEEEDDSDESASQTRVIVLSYPRYCRYRALLRRLEGTEPLWLSSSIAAALGGFTALPGTKVLFCRDTFDYPDLETHELLCNHLAPKLKGRPRRKRKKRSVSPGESSNESEASVVSTSRGSSSSLSLAPALRPPSGVRRSERNTTGDEKRFLTDVNSFMRSRGTPVGKMPLLGYRQIDLFLFYTKVQKLGGYDSVSGGRLWKTIYDDIGGNVGSTSAATITRRHYERLLLPYERHQRGEETKVRPIYGRRLKYGCLSGDTTESKSEIGRISTSEAESPLEAPTTPSPVLPLQSISSSSPFLPGEKPKTEGGKTSSLRSVRVKPERLKSLNTIAANNATIVNQNSQLPSPSPPPSSNASTTSTSNTPSSTPSTTPTSIVSGSVGVSQNVIERQLSSPLISQQVPTTTSAPSLPVSTTHSTAIVTLTPPPEKDVKEMKLDPKPTNILAQGKENIPIFGEKPIFTEKALPAPKSPEVIDLEMENDTSRDKIVIPSFKKRKLEILREGGLEVTPVELEARSSIIQATIVPVTSVSTTKIEETNGPSFSTSCAPNSIPKLISVTVTPDIGHMLPTNPEQPSINGVSHAKLTPVKSTTNRQNHQQNHQTNNNNNNGNNTSGSNSRVINVGSPSNSSLLQLYANAANSTPPSLSTSPPTSNPRFPPASSSNERQTPPKVTQSRSIFAHSEKMVYGNPKDILIPHNYHHPISQHPPSPHAPSNNHPNKQSANPILNLTQKLTDRSFVRPHLEIVRVPVVPRSSPLNLDMKSPSPKSTLQDTNARKSTFPCYGGMLDSRTMASNNLEITLVSPKHRNHPPITSQLHQPSSNSPAARLPNNPTNNIANNQRVSVSNVLATQPTQRRNQNGKFSSRLEQVSTYVSRKSPTDQPMIPNVPNLQHLNNSSFTSLKSNTVPQQAQQKEQIEEPHKQDGKEDLFAKKIVNESKNHDSASNHHGRLNDCNKPSILVDQQIHEVNTPSPAQTESSGRHDPSTSLPNNTYLGKNSQNSPGYLGQLPNSTTKFLPMLDPLYYSACYNGLFPPPMPPPSQSYMSPEFSAYYKELLASSQPKLGITGQHQPAVPTSK
ncbi:AT-rich interactive domain-containing protein 5B-like isoform X2 [Venturia canescens]|uniref:AT-rich interactive domain-containing protein 5B-like isoform X2 n=1 Tax=Venturia canescens TaxID=32260 RepID=UPI001C9D1B50|nr:AT-rich interactive domain-containing protein 5B-like isoform X2 [Venturia canescens]